MKRSWVTATVAGNDVSVHTPFHLLERTDGCEPLAPHHDPRGMAAGALCIVAFVARVVLHELRQAPNATQCGLMP